MPKSPAEGFLETRPELLRRLYEKAGAARWQLAPEEFARALSRSLEHRFRDAAAGPRERAEFLESLHVEDLALACACSAGDAAAWEHFVNFFRPELCRAGRAIAGDSLGRELADSIYAELYGLEESAGRRRPLLDYYSGRSKLTTWLRAVLAQRHVDALRASRRCDPLDESDPAGHEAEGPPAAGPDPDRARSLALLQAALVAALDQLAPRERLRLAFYYVEELTLAQIGRMLREHEATVSRQLARTRRELRKLVERRLRDSNRLSDAQVRLCFEYALEKWPFDLTRALAGRDGAGRALQESAQGSFQEKGK